MKKLCISLFFYTTCVCLFNFQFSDVFSEFGINSKEVEENLLAGLQIQRLYVPNLSSAVITACKSISPENQSAAIKKIGGLFKSYYASDKFKSQYNEWLSTKFPQTGEKVSAKKKAEAIEGRMRELQNLTATEMEPIIDVQIQSGETYAGMESMLISLPADQRTELKKQIESGKRNAAFFKKIKPLLKSDLTEFKKQYATYLAQDQIAQQEEVLIGNNKKNVLELEKWKDPVKVLAFRLAEFLEKTKDVDFTAQTKLSNNRQKFVNANFESKNRIWKFCYRIGKTPASSAREFARQWLTELK